MDKYLEKLLRIPRDQWRVNAEDVRKLWMDFPEFQEIFRYTKVMSDYDYDVCIARAVLDYNEHPPMEYYTPKNFIDRELLIKMAQNKVLEIYIGYHSSNTFTGTSGGLSVPVHERADHLRNIYDRNTQMVIEPRLTRLKDLANQSNAYGWTNHHMFI